MNQIHPSAIIGPHVVLGSGNIIGPNAIIVGQTVIGNNNWIGPATTIGIEGDIVGRPSSADEPFWTDRSSRPAFGVRIGSDNVIKEHVTIHAGSHRDTVVGDFCYLMPRSHLGHDCWVGDNVLLSPSAQVAGHVAIGSRSVIGMGALVHQFSTIGPVAMVGMGCCVRGQVAACRTVVGEPHRVSGINKIGIERLVGADNVPRVMVALKDETGQTPFPAPMDSMVQEWIRNTASRH